MTPNMEVNPSQMASEKGNPSFGMAQSNDEERDDFTRHPTNVSELKSIL